MAMPQKRKLLAVFPSMFDALGGIQTYCHAVAKSFDNIASRRDWTVEILALNDRSDVVVPSGYFDPQRVQYRGFERNKKNFAGSCIQAARHADVAFFGLVRFSPIAAGMKIANPRIKVLSALHGVEAWVRLSWGQRLGLRFMDGLASVSAYSAGRFADANGFNRHAITILPCTLDPLYQTWHDGASETFVPKDRRVLLTVSRLDPIDDYKHVDDVIRTMPGVLRSVSDAFYVIVGDGPDRPRLEALASDLKVSDAVRFEGRVPDAVLTQYYRDCSLFVLPSSGEGFGIVYLEAMYYAKPCIGVRAGGAQEVIVDGGTGLLTSEGDIAALEKSIITLLQRQDLAQQYGLNGKKRLDSEYSMEIFERRIEGLIDQTLPAG